MSLKSLLDLISATIFKIHRRYLVNVKVKGPDIRLLESNSTFFTGFTAQILFISKRIFLGGDTKVGDSTIHRS